MSDQADPSLALDEPYRPPMANGEVVFDEPWQARTFAMAVALAEQGIFKWAEFQKALITRVGHADASHTDDADYRYFDHFAGALTDLLGGLSVVGSDALNERTDEFAARPDDHDHDHPHSHSH